MRRNFWLPAFLLATSAILAGLLSSYIYHELLERINRPDAYTAKALEQLADELTALRNRPAVRPPTILRESFPLVDTATGGGSGVVIQVGEADALGIATGVVLTCAHVVDDVLFRGTEVRPGLTLHDNPTGIVVKCPSYALAVQSVLLNKIDDLALLRVVFPRAPLAIPIAKVDAELGELVWSVSWPSTPIKAVDSPKQLFSVTLGCRSVENRFTAPISPGSSGGALLNQAGELVGLTEGVYCMSNEQLGILLPIYHMATGVSVAKLNQFLTRSTAASQPTSR